MVPERGGLSVHKATGIICRMQLVIPFAVPVTEAGRHAALALQLPQLQQWLGSRVAGARDDGDEWSLTPPHERALARARAWAGADGALPFAAHAARADGIDVGDLAWGLLTPAHWHLGTEQISLVDPAALVLDETTSRALFEAVSPLFTSDGFVLAWGAPERWYAAHEMFAELPVASLDRVIGRNVDRWLGADPAARRVRRLQAEVQMLLHEHAVNREREARGQLPVNSFWLSGCGVAQAATGDAVVDDRLRAPALAGDWAAWAKAWEAIDEGLAHTPEAMLTLCGERGGASFGPTRRGFAGPAFWQRRQGAAAWAQLVETL
jgi:hypothetical protein